MDYIEGKFGKVIFCDNLDKDHGLPSLKDKSWDLCLTDPPYGINYKQQDKFAKRENKINYKDSQIEYKTYIQSVMKELLRVCRGIYIFPGNMNVFLYPKPRDIHIHYKPNAVSPGSQAHKTSHDMILIYGKFNNKVAQTVYRVPLDKEYMKEKYIHPCPNNSKLYEYIIKQIKPNSILDPFIGSGTTGEVAEMYGIKWYGMEIMSEFAPDIRTRLERGNKKRKHLTKQRKLFE